MLSGKEKVDKNLKLITDLHRRRSPKWARMNDVVLLTGNIRTPFLLDCYSHQ